MRNRGPKPAIPSQNLAIDRYEFAASRLERLLPELPSKTVYDMGVGDGRMRKVESLGLTWRGFDYHAWQDITKWELSDPCPVDEKAGAAILLDVIEHCTSPGIALKNIANALLPNARLVITVPNPRWSASRIHNLVFGWPSGFTQLDIDENHHIWTPFPHHLEEMLRQAGFVVEEYVTLDGKTKPFGARLSFARMLIEAMDKSACGMCYGFVARKI